MDRHHSSAPSLQSLRRNVSLCALFLCAIPIGACSRGGSDPAGTTLSQTSSSSSTPGDEIAKPGGGTFFLDPNRSGSATVLHLAEMFWGRLVDIHDTDASGEERAEPRFRDLLIDQN